MKPSTFLIALLLVTSTAFSQSTYDRSGRLTKHRVVSDKVRFVALAATSIILNGVGDALNANPNTKSAGHIFNACSIGTLVATPFVVNYNKRKWYIYALSYGFIRAGIFDPAYNISRKLPYNYTGTSNVWDRFWKQNGGRNVFDMSLFLTVGIAIPLNEL